MPNATGKDRMFARHPTPWTLRWRSMGGEVVDAWGGIVLTVSHRGHGPWGDGDNYKQLYAFIVRRVNAFSALTNAAAESCINCPGCHGTGRIPLSTLPLNDTADCPYCSQIRDALKGAGGIT